MYTWNNRKIMERFAVDHKCLPQCGYILSRNKDVYKILAYNKNLIQMNHESNFMKLNSKQKNVSVTFSTMLWPSKSMYSVNDNSEVLLQWRGTEYFKQCEIYSF